METKAHTDTAVVTSPLGEGASVTLIQDEDGWRFDSWALHTGVGAPPPPSGPDLERRFPTEEAARDYFRSIWPA